MPNQPLNRPTIQQKIALAAVKAQLNIILENVDERFIGEVGDGIMAPVTSLDGRKLTWRKFLTSMVTWPSVQRTHSNAYKLGRFPPRCRSVPSFMDSFQL